MATGVFLRKEVIETDLKNFCKGMEKKIEGSFASLYENQVSDSATKLGFTIDTGRANYHVYMHYEINERYEHAISDKQWYIEVDDEVTGGYPSLQQVIDFINDIESESESRAKYVNLFSKVAKVDGQLIDIVNSLDKNESPEVVESLKKVYEAFLEAEETISKVGKLR